MGYVPTGAAGWGPWPWGLSGQYESASSSSGLQFLGM